jgi:hypothetical protein
VWFRKDRSKKADSFKDIAALRMTCAGVVRQAEQLVALMRML